MSNLAKIYLTFDGNLAADSKINGDILNLTILLILLETCSISSFLQNFFKRSYKGSNRSVITNVNGIK